MSRFLDKSVLITGGGRGLGHQLAVDFAREGANVTVNYSSSAAAADETVKRITETGGQAIACHADIARLDDVTAMVEQVVTTYGGVDILINNAGLSIDKPFLELSEKDWDQAMGVNLKGPFLLSQAVGRLMVAAGQGRIVNISAATAIQARIGNANYAASKAGLNMLTQSMALELGPHVTVNAVGLGFVDSALVRELFTPEQIEQAKDNVPVKRMTTYEETSAFVLMLASDTASFVTGQTIPFDGGGVMR
ncbi:MAG: SDR family oxidoreductase [Rhodospirillales bacterium]|jgi:3-oxoacyl-[acyl-carrier protein] reductase|nr:SDR family oxidoreductase [Rhodospirillales bacterium]MBT4039789.1 SDR family oxidoreductase [Rhodospirillales bacterium]MBT4627069.1 SDR family oxidoreductase [Rhodospirillales bacterium]MBT5350794.1 SDR family oxidoreductase [Rhodospirillales bacterium]MBT5521365.1 SDR family oxidoreductase [Rhodospirillales bacterium]